MQKTSIVILSYNTYEYTRLCIESIRKYTKKGTYELIVVDNASTDQSIVWLKKQKDIRCVFNKTNEGFPKGCNQGMQIARGSEILLLNSDTVVTTHWLDILLQALYSDQKIGAVGCVTNCCSNRQQVDVSYQSVDEMQEFAKTFNRADPNKWERSLTLVGFCFLFKKDIYQEIGGMDEKFSPGNFEDDDYSLRIWQAGYELLLCRDVFIHHFGSASFRLNVGPEEKAKRNLAYGKVLNRNFRLFHKKWNLSEHYKVIHEILYVLPKKINKGSRVLLLDAGSSLDLFVLQKKYPNVEFVSAMTQKGDAIVISYAFHTTYVEDLENDLFEKIDGKFDLIICIKDMKEFIDPAVFLEKLTRLLYSDGKLFFVSDGKVSIKKKMGVCSKEYVDLDVLFTSFLQKKSVDGTLLGNYDVESLLSYIINQVPLYNQVEVLNQLAVWFSENGRQDDVIPCLNQALELAPGDILSTKNLGIFLFSLKEYDLAGKYLSKITNDTEVEQLLHQMRDTTDSILFINHNWGGGTTVFLEQYIHTFCKGKKAYCLEPSLNEKDGKYEYVFYNVHNQQDRQVVPVNEKVLTAFVQELNIHEIFVNHLLGYELFFVMKWILSLKLPVKYFIHDYFCICPNNAFLECERKFCDENKSNKICRHYFANKGFPSLDLKTYQSWFHDFLRQIDTIYAPTQYAADTVKEVYSDIHISIQPHRLAIPFQKTFQDEFAFEKILTVAFLGDMWAYKGGEYMLLLNEYIQRFRLPVRFVLIGEFCDDLHIGTKAGIEVTGRYDNKKISAILKSHKVAFVAALSICQETYCYTASEAILSGYPVLAFNIGAHARRIKAHDCGWIMPLDSPSKGVKELVEFFQWISGDDGRKDIVEKAKNTYSFVNGME